MLISLICGLLSSQIKNYAIAHHLSFYLVGIFCKIPSLLFLHLLFKNDFHDQISGLNYTFDLPVIFRYKVVVIYFLVYVQNLQVKLTKLSEAVVNESPQL